MALEKKRAAAELAINMMGGKDRSAAAKRGTGVSSTLILGAR